MDRKATTFRLDSVCKEGLAKLSEILHQPLNKLVNEAIREYVARRTLEVENELASTLEDLRAFRKSDPHFERSIAAFVDAEISAKHDPAEGNVVTSAGPAERRVLGLLND